MQLKPLGASVIAAIAGLGAAPSVTRAQAGNALEEVIVTATRRAVSVQDTPLSVTAITSEALAVQNIENVQDLTAAVPNVLSSATTPDSRRR